MSTPMNNFGMAVGCVTIYKIIRVAVAYRFRPHVKNYGTQFTAFTWVLGVRRADPVSFLTGQAVQTWSFVLLFRFSAGRQFCSPKPARTQSVGTLAAMLFDRAL